MYMNDRKYGLMVRMSQFFLSSPMLGTLQNRHWSGPQLLPQ